MDKIKISYPIPSQGPHEAESAKHLIIKSVFASICGASIPAVIFYFLM
jgi:hypothetical protein